MDAVKVENPQNPQNPQKTLDTPPHLWYAFNMKSKRINDLISTGLLAHGAKKVVDPHYSREIYSIQTKYGELIVTLNRPESRANILSCYSRFTDVEKAKGKTSCNPYSGKWNFTIFSRGIKAEDFANMVLYSIKDILTDTTKGEYNGQ